MGLLMQVLPSVLMFTMTKMAIHEQKLELQKPSFRYKYKTLYTNESLLFNFSSELYLILLSDVKILQPF